MEKAMANYSIKPPRNTTYYDVMKNLYHEQEATVRTEQGNPEWFGIGKGVRQGCILSPYLFNLYAEIIMRNADLQEELNCWR